MADCLGTRQGRSCLGRRREKISGFDRRVRRRRRRPCESERRQGRPEADGTTAARDGRRASARAQGRTGARIEPDHFERWTNRRTQNARRRHSATGKIIFSNSGFEAVEAALKTAMLATGKHGVIAFKGAYHGLGYGALNATHRDFFRRPFRSQLARIRPLRPVSNANPPISPPSKIPNPPSFPPRMDRRDPRRADPGARRHQRSAAGISAAAAKTVRRTRRAADPR